MSYRNNTTFLMVFIQNLVYMSIGKANYQVSKEYFEENREQMENPGMIDAMYPFLKWGIIGINMSRIILILTSVKDLRLCKTYFYI